jgi:cytochrome P450
VKQNEDWKQTRKRFNPGFAPQHLMSLLPCILDKTDIFVHHLDNLANSGKEFTLLKFAINLTFDIIGAVVMGVDFDAQHADSSSQGEFIRLYDELLSTYNGSGLERLPQWMFVRREWRRYRLSSKIDRLLEGMIRQKHAEGANSSKTNASSRSVLNLSLQGSDSQTGTLSDDLVHETRDQIKTFLFAGHDTTSILLAWLFYELARTPRALKAVRDELDDIFGPDADPVVVRQKLLAPGGEDLIHRMTYTSAVIKEILRLYPPAGTARMAPRGSNFTVQLPDGGGSFCVDGFVIYNCATLIQRDRTVFGESAGDFVPERWLGDKSGIMSAGSNNAQTGSGAGADSGRKYPAGAWRPFERGPRNCIGQDLATIEARVIIAAVARRYDFVKVGLGELDLDEKGQPVLNEKGQFKVKAEMYNTQQVTAKPVDGMRMKVRRR